MRRLKVLVVLLIFTPGCLILTEGDIDSIATSMDRVGKSLDIVQGTLAEVAAEQGDPNKYAAITNDLAKVKTTVTATAGVVATMQDAATDPNAIAAGGQVVGSAVGGVAGATIAGLTALAALWMKPKKKRSTT